MRNIEWGARVAWGEARDQGAGGMQAVINVMQNRANDRRYPDSIADVATQPFQFSAFNEGNANKSALHSVADDDPEFRVAVGLATFAVDGSLGDLTGGATHYYAARGPNKISPPFWIRESPNAVRTASIGNHDFYKGIA